MKAGLVTILTPGRLEPRIVLADLLDDRFEIKYLISGGGMGEVFRGHDRASGTAVAIKVLTDARGHHAPHFGITHPGDRRTIHITDHHANTGWTKVAAPKKRHTFKPRNR